MASDSLSLALLLLLLFHAEASGSGISQVELVGGHSRCEGRLEVTYRGTRGTVCPDTWTTENAAVVCAQLGCGPLQEVVTNTRFGAGKGPDCLSGIECFSTEKELSACDPLGFSWIETNHMWDAGVVCSPSGISSVKLLNGLNSCMGNLEVAIGNERGTVCDKDWGSQDAAVVCKELSCGAATVMQRGVLSTSSPLKNSLLTSAFCTGSESSLSKCGARMGSCASSEVAEVSCAPDSGNLELRLADGVGRCDGRVEVQYNSTWGSVSQYQWDMQEAQVVCRQLGCGEARTVMRDGHFGLSRRVVWLSATYCNGSESRLSDCGLFISRDPLPPHPTDAVGVICEGPLSTWVRTFVVLRGTFYFLVYVVIHLVYFIAGKRSSRLCGLRKGVQTSDEAVEEEVVV